MHWGYVFLLLIGLAVALFILWDVSNWLYGQLPSTWSKARKYTTVVVCAIGAVLLGVYLLILGL